MGTVIRVEMLLAVDGEWDDYVRAIFIRSIEDLMENRPEDLQALQIRTNPADRDLFVAYAMGKADGTLPKALSLPDPMVQVEYGFRLEPLSPEEQRAYDAALAHSIEENLRPYPTEALDFGPSVLDCE